MFIIIIINELYTYTYTLCMYVRVCVYIYIYMKREGLPRRPQHERAAPRGLPHRAGLKLGADIYEPSSGLVCIYTYIM